MRYIIDGLMYDTETAEVVYKYIYDHTTPRFLKPSEPIYQTIYKTKNGRYFVWSDDLDFLYSIDEYEVKHKILDNDIDKYEEIFGEIPEA